MITINGYYRNGDYELIHTGEGADPEAVCSFTYDHNCIEEALDLLHMIKESLRQSLAAEQEKKEAEIRKAKINSILLKEGHPGLPDGMLDRILNTCGVPGCEYLDGCGQTAVN